MSSIKLFESKQIRSEWNESEQKWYFAIIDVIEVLTESSNPRRYWSDLKRKLSTEGFSQLYEIIVQLKMISSDGKRYVTDCADAKGLLRIIQPVQLTSKTTKLIVFRIDLNVVFLDHENIA